MQTHTIEVTGIPEDLLQRLDKWMREQGRDRSQFIREIIEEKLLEQEKPHTDRPMMDEKTWEQVNARRCELIRRKYTEGIHEAERAELDDLEEKATRYLNSVAPLATYPLAELQAHVDRIKGNQKNGQ